MVKTINFNTWNINWTDNYECNRSFIECTVSWIYELLHIRGYLYLTDIYDRLGAVWNPHEDNSCILYKEPSPLVLSWTHLEGNDFKITIYY